MAVDVQRPDAELEERLAERTTELREAYDQQAAIAEILQLINDSPGDSAPVFDAMLDKAISLCGAAFGTLMVYDGERFNRVATRGSEGYRRFVDLTREQQPVHGPNARLSRILAGERVIHIADLMADPAYKEGDPYPRALVHVGGARTLLGVTLVKGEVIRGVIAIFRKEVRPFSERQIALLQNFAAQAVIALENVRLITEQQQRTRDLEEALDQQTATTKILQVINSSPGDLSPVFDAMLEEAMRVCGAAFGTLLTYDGERFTRAAVRGGERFMEWARNHPPVCRPGNVPTRILEGERVVHIADLAAEPRYKDGDPNTRARVDLAGARTSLAVPLLNGKSVRGILTISAARFARFPTGRSRCCRILRRRRWLPWRMRG